MYIGSSVATSYILGISCNCRFTIIKTLFSCLPFDHVVQITYPYILHTLILLYVTCFGFVAIKYNKSGLYIPISNTFISVDVRMSRYDFLFNATTGILCHSKQLPRRYLFVSLEFSFTFTCRARFRLSICKILHADVIRGRWQRQRAGHGESDITAAG